MKISDSRRNAESANLKIICLFIKCSSLALYYAQARKQQFKETSVELMSKKVPILNKPTVS